MILLRLGDCFVRNSQVGHEFVKPMLAENAATEEVVDPAARLPEVDAGADVVCDADALRTAGRPVFVEQGQQRVRPGGSGLAGRRWSGVEQGGGVRSTDMVMRLR